MTDKGFLLQQYNGESSIIRTVQLRKEDFCPVDSEEKEYF